MHRLFQGAALAVALLACRSAEPSVSSQVLDDAGRPVRASNPERIVSLAPNLTELLFVLDAGDRIVGRTRWCDYPPEAATIPSVGDGLNPNVEVIAARRPDLVLLYASPSNDHVIDQLEAMGITTLSLRTDRFADLTRSAEVLGRVTGTRAVADSLNAALRAELEELESTRPQHPPLSALLLAWDDPPIVVGSGSFLSEIVGLAGARNVFDDLPSSSATVSIETIAQRDPDVVLVTSDSTQPGWVERPEWKVVPAIRERRFLVVSGSAYNRPSFRGPGAVRRLRAVLREQVR